MMFRDHNYSKSSPNPLLGIERGRFVRCQPMQTHPHPWIRYHSRTASRIGITYNDVNVKLPCYSSATATQQNDQAMIDTDSVSEEMQKNFASIVSHAPVTKREGVSYRVSQNLQERNWLEQCKKSCRVNRKGKPAH